MGLRIYSIFNTWAQVLKSNAESECFLSIFSKFINIPILRPAIFYSFIIVEIKIKNHGSSPRVISFLNLVIPKYFFYLLNT
jgi:hypothetical protein